MKKAFMILAALCFVSSLAFAQGSSGTETVMIKGDIIDNMCLDAHKSEDIAQFIKTHAKQCAISPECEAAGYSIYSDGVVNKFDQDSNAKIAEFLKKEGSNLQAAVTAQKSGEVLSLVSIENQK
ncbi:MAG: hypothetical protein AABZ27_04155 [Candidatus Omnitrophota bacterium]